MSRASSKKYKNKPPRTSYSGYSQVQNVKSARVYVFGNNDCYNEGMDTPEDDIELFNVRSRHSVNQVKPSKPDPIIFERQISEDDSLVAIALQYSCSVSELRRMNHLMCNQDFYALRTIRIPIKPYSLLSETIPTDTSSNVAAAASATVISETGNSEPGAAGSTEENHVPDNYMSDPEIQDRVIRTISIRENTRRGADREAREFLHNMDKDLESIRNTTPLHKASLEDVTSMLTSKSIQPLHKSSGALICGYRVPWYVVISVILLLIFVIVPMVLFIYRRSIFPSLEHNTNNT